VTGTARSIQELCLSLSRRFRGGRTQEGRCAAPAKPGCGLFLAVVTGRRWGRSDAEGRQVRLNAVR
jgi:hypothetical protein